MTFSAFFSQNIILFIAAIGITVYLIYLEVSTKLIPATIISSAKLAQLTNRNIPIIDLRSNEDFKKKHIIDAINIPFDKLEEQIGSKATPEKPVILYCQKGITTAKASKQLHRLGYKEILLLKDGMDGWIQEGMPVVQA